MGFMNILLVDDEPYALKHLKRIVSEAVPDSQVNSVGTAEDAIVRIYMNKDVTLSVFILPYPVRDGILNQSLYRECWEQEALIINRYLRFNITVEALFHQIQIIFYGLKLPLKRYIVADYILYCFVSIGVLFQSTHFLIYISPSSCDKRFYYYNFTIDQSINHPVSS